MNRELLLEKAKTFLRAICDFLITLSGNILFYTGLVGFFTILFDYGFPHSEYVERLLPDFYILILKILLWFSAADFFLHLFNKPKLYSFLSKLVLFLLLGMVAGIIFLFPQWADKYFPFLLFFRHPLSVHLVIMLSFFFSLGKKSLAFNKLNIHPAQLLIFSFLLIILFGTALLLMPNSTVNGIRFTDALFTSVSAVCVTGLTVVDTAAHFTPLGKLIILLLIQAGGLGIMTFTSFFGFFFSGGSSFRDQLFLKDFLNTEKMSEVFGIIIKIIFITLLIEGMGAAAIYYHLPDNIFPTSSAQIKFSVFHSISAFCNAGFSTLSEGLCDVRFRSDYSLHLILAILIILGGLGFPVVFNYYSYTKHYAKNFFRIVFQWKKFEHSPRLIHVNTKLAIRTTAVLLLAGTLLLFIFEFGNSFGGMNWDGKITTAFFSTATSRTAGFNTIDFSVMTHGSILFVIFLMWAGASPGSTGGGIKTTTLAVAILNVLSLAKGKDRVEVFRREISNESVRRAYSILFLSMITIGSGFFLLSLFEPDKDFEKILFETVSAFSTTGLSLGITADLSDAGKTVIIFLMFIGRIGALTLLVAFIRKAKTLHYRYPSENIFIN